MTLRIPLVLLGIALVSPRALAQSRSGIVNVGDARLSYEVSGQGTPIVFIHGWSQDRTIWDDQVAAFARSHRVIRYDVRGFGESTGAADITEDPNDLRILLDSLGIRAAHVVGLSRGARAALSFAVAFPDRVDALVLYGLSPPEGFQPAPTGPGIVAVLGEIARKQGLDSAGKAMLASPLVWRPADDTLRMRVLRIAQAGWAKYRGRDLLEPHQPSGRIPLARVEQLGAIRVPTLVVHGDHEMPLMQSVADTVVRRIPGALKVVIPNAGHGAHFYAPAQFNRVLLAFFRSVERTGD